MIQKKRICNILAILVCFCILITGIAASSAETSSAQEDVYVLVRNTAAMVDYDPQDIIPDCLTAIQFLYPDYIDVVWHVYKMADFKNPTGNSCVELFSGSLDGADSRERLKQSLATLGDPDRSGVSIARIMEMQAGNNGSIVFVGDFNSENMGTLRSKWIPELKDAQYVILNANTKVKAEQDIITINGNDLLTAVQSAYLYFNKDRFDQNITEENLTGIDYAGTVDEDARAVRLLTPSHTYYGNKDLYYSSEKMTLIEVEQGAKEYKLELEDNGKAKRILINTIYDPFTIISAEIPEIKDQYTMNDAISFVCTIGARGGQTIKPFIPEEWQVNAVIIDSNGEKHKEPMNWNGSLFECKYSLRDDSGQFKAEIEAKNTRETWIGLTADIGSFTVSNNPPTLNQKADEEQKKLTIWADEPLHLENQTEVALDYFFQDDGPKEDLTYEAEGDIPAWVKIEGNKLIVDTEQIDKSASIKIIAKDKGNQASSDKLEIRIDYYPVKALMEGTEAILTINGNDDGRIYRDSKIDLTADVHFPGTVQPYWDYLTEKGRLNEFVDKIIGEFLLGGEKLTAIADTVQLEGKNDIEPLQIRLTQISDRLRDPGETEVSFTATIPDQTYTLAKVEDKIDVLNKAPAVISGIVDESYNKEIPGPLILNKEIPTEAHEINIDLSALINPEVSEEITVDLSSGQDIKLYVQDGEYYFTDEPTDDMKEAEMLIWQTKEKAPVLHISSGKHGEYEVKVSIKDEREIEAKNSPLNIRISNKYHDEETLIIIVAVIAGVILLLILFCILKQVLKPKFKEKDILTVGVDKYNQQIPLQSWGKKSLTLRDLLIYSGVPVIGELPVKALDKVEFKAGGKRKPLAILNAQKTGLEVKVDGAVQYNNKIGLTTDNTAELKMNENETITIKITEENSAM